MAVTRAFGDKSMKDNRRREFCKQRVTAVCDCATLTLKKNDGLMLFCDGLVEQWSNEKLIKILRGYTKIFHDPAYGLGSVFDDIVAGEQQQPSRDNMSCVYIQMRGI